MEAIAEELASAQGYAEKSWANSTVKAYGHDWAVFEMWCEKRGQQSLPAAPATVAAFLASEADKGRRSQTITRRAAAIRYQHHTKGHPNPCEAPGVRAVLSGIRRRPKPKDGKRRKVDPLRPTTLGLLLAHIPTTTHLGRRDRALLLLGFAAALRRSELVALTVEDLEFDLEKGLLVTVTSSKTDQEGKGTLVAVPYAGEGNERLCPVRAVSAWLQHARIEEGPVFRHIRRGDAIAPLRKVPAAEGVDVDEDDPDTFIEVGLSDQSVALIVKRRAEAADLDAKLVSKLAGHSLRSGYATAAAAAGIEERKIANVTRHKNLDVLRGYIRPAIAFDDVGHVL